LFGAGKQQLDLLINHTTVITCIDQIITFHNTVKSQ